MKKKLMPNTPPSIYAFVDSQNVNLATLNCGWKLNFARFFVYLKDKYKVSKAFLFIGCVGAELTLHTMIKKPNYGN
ncbi:MAG: hypothetical protein ACYDIA_00115 [Candidatus Humimicrobiaceae bacterium]